jgi:hypothetical protein
VVLVRFPLLLQTDLAQMAVRAVALVQLGLAAELVAAHLGREIMAVMELLHKVVLAVVALEQLEMMEALAHRLVMAVLDQFLTLLVAIFITLMAAAAVTTQVLQLLAVLVAEAVAHKTETELMRKQIAALAEAGAAGVTEPAVKAVAE